MENRDKIGWQAVWRTAKDYLPAVPFAVWIAMQSFLPATALNYAARSAATLAALAGCLYLVRREGGENIPGPACRLSALLPGLAAGLFVAAFWILPEHMPFYRKWILWPFGVPLPEPSGPSPYDPEVCGRALMWIKLAGSAFVIAPVEEIFFRSYLYRWIQQGERWREVDLSRFNASAFVWTVGLFALEHSPRFAVAAACGAVYQLVAMKRGLAAAIAAHITTNLVLAAYVIYFGDWGFW